MSEQPPENSTNNADPGEKPDASTPPAESPTVDLNDTSGDKPKPRSTTFDVAKDAEEALRMYQNSQKDMARKLDEAAREGQVITGEDAMIRVEVQGGGTPLLLPLSGDIIIGRRDPSTHTSPELDLTPYGAYQMGISRRHAIIRLKDNKTMLTDLGSRNGTYINGKKLKAHQPIPLADGDEVRLGKIVMQIHFETEESESGESAE